MLSSKANAALARLKEIEEKYRTKRREQKWKEVNIPKRNGTSVGIRSVNNFLVEKIDIEIMISRDLKEKSFSILHFVFCNIPSFEIMIFLSSEKNR